MHSQQKRVSADWWKGCNGHVVVTTSTKKNKYWVLAWLPFSSLVEPESC